MINIHIILLSFLAYIYFRKIKIPKIDYNINDDDKS